MQKDCTQFSSGAQHGLSQASKMNSAILLARVANYNAEFDLSCPL